MLSNGARPWTCLAIFAGALTDATLVHHEDGPGWRCAVWLAVAVYFLVSGFACVVPRASFQNLLPRLRSLAAPSPR